MRELRRSIEEDDRRVERDRIARDAVAIRERCKTLIGFVREFWPILEPSREFVCGWAIEAMAKHLEAVTNGNIQYLLMNVPPGMMKSLLVSVFWPAWEWGPMGKAANGYLASSFGLDNVLRDNVKMRRIIESDKFQAIWGASVRQGGKWGERKFENTATGVRAGRSFAKMTGGRGDRVLIDDPHDTEGAESDDQRTTAVRIFRESIPDRLNDMQRSAIVVIMQRLHANDVSGTILKLKLPYVHLCLPMEFEAYREENGKRVDARCRTYDRHGNLLFEDPRELDGELLFPERFPREVVEGLKIAKGSYAYAGQYQQRPTAREGGLFKRAWFSGKIISRQSLGGIHLSRCRAWDFAASTEKPGADPDWSASARVGRHETDYYIEHVERMRESPGIVQRSVVGRAETDPPGTVHRIPVDPAQAGLFQADSYVKAMAGHVLRAVKTSGRGDKTARAVPLSIQAEFGHVWIVNSGAPDDGLDPWIEPFLDELCSFPASQHDDQVDAVSDAFGEVAAMPSARIESASAGRSDIVGAAERDSRYNFGDNTGPASGGLGWGSSGSTHGVM
jgi:predicted phage terminase large subunit-like protein